PPASDSAEALWSALGSNDVRAAYFAMQDLSAMGSEGIAMLQQRLQELVKSQALDVPQQITLLIRELDHDDFNRRDRASAQLAEFGTLATQSLREALEKDPTPEARQRLTTLLAAPAQPQPQPERMQALRTIEILERI